MRADELNRLEGRLVTVVYDDGSVKPSVIKGDLISISDDSITIETLRNVLVISLSCILKVKAALNEGEARKEGSHA